ncbi:acyl-CoA carboxylase subunit beta [Bacteroidota bacterium]
MISREEKYKEFIKLAKDAELGGGYEKILKQRKRNRLTARERINLFLDPGSFTEADKFVRHFNHDFGMENKRFYGDGVVTGYGYIESRLVYIFSQDFTVLGGTLSRSNADKIKKIMEMALKNGAPIIGIKDSGGARIQEGVDSMAGYADLFYLNVQCSGVIPQVSAIMGPCAGGAVYSPALTDFILMVEKSSYMFLTGPNVVKAVLEEEISMEELGGATTHNEVSGVAHFQAKSDEAAILMLRNLISYLPSNNTEKPPKIESNDNIKRETHRIMDIIPEDNTLPYDVKEVIHEVFDKDSFFEVHSLFALNIVIGFARLGGESVGIVANQPLYLAGALDIDASRKAAKFVRFCDSFNIPIISLVDVPGFLPGIDQEFNGIITHGAKLMYAYSEATVPLLTLITRKGYGGAYDVMASKHLKADMNLAYPSAEIAVMGSSGAVNILYKNATEKEKIKHKENYERQFDNPYIAAEKGYIDDIILPKDTRKVLYNALITNQNKKEERVARKHGNIPL